MKATAICVESSARLHLGFYNFYEDGVAYGGLGVAIESPRIIVKVDLCPRLSIVNKTNNVYIDDIIELVRERFNFDKMSIEVLEAYPRHIGLGSTTQLSLSIGYGISRLLDLGYSIRELAVILGRGRDSGIGVSVFEYGGFVVDSGRRVSGIVTLPRNIGDIPYPIFKSYLPDDWYFIIVIPHNIKGFDEVKERKAMDIPQSLPKDLQLELYKLVLLHIIPSIIRKDAEVFGKAVTKLQMIVGNYFARYQGGVFCCREVEDIAKILIDSGVYGVGQSSWGPAIYGITENRKRAEKILNIAIEKINNLGINYSYYLTRARNRGAVTAFC